MEIIRHLKERIMSIHKNRSVAAFIDAFRPERIIVDRWYAI